MPAEGFTVFIDLLPQAYRYWFDPVLRIDDGNFFVQSLRYLFRLPDNIVRLRAQQFDRRPHLMNILIGNEAEFMQHPQLGSQRVAKACAW